MTNMESPIPTSIVPSLRADSPIISEVALNRGAMPSVSAPCRSPSSIVTSQSTFGSVSLSNSSNVMFGDRTFYQGPVTINQFLMNQNEGIQSSPENPQSNYATSDESSPSGKDDKTKFRIPSLVKGRCHPERKMVFIVAGTILVGLIVLLSVIGVLTSAANSDLSNTHELTTSSEDTNQSQNESDFRIITRGEWMAQPPSEPVTSLVMPISTVIVSHTAGGNCPEQKTCTFLVQNIQSYHMKTRGWSDIGFNFLVGGDGAIYEGRGWDKQGVHTLRYNSKSICIAFMGDFTEKTPPAKQVNAALQLLAEGLEMHKLTADYRLFAQRQLINTESPGLALFKVIQKWPHWSDKVS